MIFVLCNIAYEVKDLLPHFLKHYINLKVDGFVFGVLQGADNPAWHELLNICQIYDIPYYITTSYKGQIDGIKEFESLDRLRVEYVKEGDWYVPTDLDEFHLIPPEIESYPELVKKCIELNIETSLTHIIDRVTNDLSVPPTIDPNIPIYDQFPKEMDITKAILGAHNEKIILAKHNIAIWGGHHNSAGTCSFPFGKTLHFKWFGNLWKKEKEKYEAYTKQGLSYSEENRKLLELLAQHEGRLGQAP